MNEKFFALIEKRSANLRLSGIALALVISSLLLARSYVYFQVEFIFVIALLYVAELSVVWLLLRRLEKIPDEPHTTLLLKLTGQIQVLAELVLLTWAVYYTGGITSPLLPLYFIYIFADGLTSSTRALVLHAVGAYLFVVAVTVGTYAGWLVRYNIGLFPETELWRNPGFVTGALIVFGAMMIVTLVVSITFSRRTTQRELELGESAGQLSVRVQQVSHMRDVGQRLASSLELDQVLDAVGQSALKIVSATDVHIYPYDEDTGQFLPGVGVWSDGHRGTVVNTPRPDGLSARVIKTKHPIIINDAANNSLYQSLQARTWGLQAIAGFPLIKAERVVGVLNVAFLEPHHFSHQEQEALLVLADQAAIALDNARLYTQVQRKMQELSALNAVTQTAAQLTDKSSMLNDALGAVLTAISADAALVGTLNEQRNVLELAAHRGLTAAALNESKNHPLRVGEGFGGLVIQSGKPHFAAEVSRDPHRFRLGPIDNFTSIYTVPLRAYDRMIGVLQLLWQDQHKLTATEVSLTGAIAPQLAAAIYNSTLFNETRRRADELTTLRAIGLATTSTLNLREQLRLLYENVNQLLRADTFFVGLFDETRDELRIEYAVEEGWFLRPIQVPLEQAGLSGWVLKNQKSLRASDLQNGTVLPTQPIHITRPARSWLGVPLMLKERILGLISAQSFEPDAFTAEDERFLIAVAQHVALALDNARLFAESERRTRELTLLNEISRAISASLDLDEIMRRAARALADQLGYRYVSIYEFDGDRLVCKATVADNDSLEAWDVSRGVIGRVARTGRAAFITNVEADPDYVNAHADVVSEICVPIVREGRVLGLVNIEESRAGALKDDDLALLSVLAEQLAIAASNAALYHEALRRERFATRLGQLGMTVTSTLDLVQLIDILCRESLALFGSDTAAIYLREVIREGPRPESRALASVNDSSSVPERARLVCRAAAGTGRDQLLGTAVEIDQLGNLLARTLRLGRGAVVHDARSSTQFSPEFRAIVQPEACLAVPIMKERDVIGVLLLCDRQDPEHFGEPELAGAQIVASQAGLALSNAHLLAEAQRRAKEQSSLYEIGLAISSTLDLQEQLHIIYEQVAKHFQLSGFDIALRGENNELEFALYIEQGKPLPPFSKPLGEAGFAGWVVSSRRALVIDDIKRQADTLPVKPGEHGSFNDTASYIGIPLMTKSEAMGVMALQRAPVEPFTADEQRFLFALAQQVAFAVDNARLHEQSQRHAAQQSLLYRASRRIAGALNLDTLLTGIVDALSQDLSYQGVLVMLVEHETNELRPAAISADIRSVITPSYRQPIGVGLMGLAAQTGRTQLSNDTRDDARYLSNQEWRPLSKVAVSIRSGEQVIGVLNVESADASAFADEDVRMFEAIADQLAVAIENANLFTRAQERLARINALQNIQVAILSTMNLVDRLDLILEHAVTQMRAHLGVIFMRDHQTRELYGLRQRGSHDLVALREVRIKPGEGAAGWIMEHAEPLYIADVNKDARWTRTAASVNEGVVSYLGVPLRVKERTIGVIDVGTRTPRLFTDEEINFFTTLASHAAVAIENARLYEQTNAQLEQLRDTQDRLVESERRAAIGELVAGLAHEINNPLTAIVGHSQLLMETIPLGPSMDSWRIELDTISGAAQRISRIVQEFITLSHVEGGHAETVNLAEVIHTAVEKFQGRDDSQDIAISETMPAEPLWVRANPQLMEQVLNNLLTNSLEAMPHGGAIEVTAGSAESGQIFCAVRDSGYGVPLEDLKRVFEPGYTTKVEAGVVRGIGLGLYTAQRIVVSHGGTILIESREGKFTVATFTCRGQNWGGEINRMPTERLLVVDDDPAILALCHRILEADGYTVADAKRGEEALAKLEAEPFDLLLTDIRLPGLNGLEVTRRLRDRGLELTVVTMTGYSNMEMAIQALSLGVDEFLVKPFTLDSLRLTITRALEKWRLRREIMRLRTLVPLLKTSQDLTLARTRTQVYDRLFDSVCLIFKTDQVAFIESSRDGRMLTVASAHGTHLAPLRDQIFLNSQLVEPHELLSSGATVWNERATPRLPFELPGVTWLVAAPFVVRDQPLGLLLASVMSAPSASDQEALRLIASHAASSLENVDLLGELSRALVTVREAERLKSEFINIAGHELRTPLTVLVGYAELLRSRVSGELQGYATQVMEQAERLQHIADDMLKLQSLEAGHTELRLECCAVDQVLRQVVSAYRPLALEREQSIEMELDEKAGCVTADRAMLDVMLGSLISNAIKFSPRNTRVRVAARGDQSHVTLQVQDQGIGLTPEQGERVFDAFYQASPSLTREKGGLGIGLTLTREMVNAHGGKIWFEPSRDSGTSFYISLPRECVLPTRTLAAQNF